MLWSACGVCLWFRFKAGSTTAICSRFSGPEGVINGSCGNYGSFLAWGGPLRAVGGAGGGLMVSAQGSELGARTPTLPKFSLLGSFSDTSLVVSILYIVYDCHLQPLLQS